MKKIEPVQLFGILANIGVLIGILLLVYELYQNRLMMRAQARSDISDTLVELLVDIGTDPVIAEINEKARAGVDLTALEAAQFEQLQRALWRYRENVNYQYRSGLFEEEEYIAQREVWIENINSNARMRSIWCTRVDRTSPDFVAEMNELMEVPCE